MAASGAVDLFKFPRTKHLFDAGGSGVSRDDLLMDKGEESLFYSRAASGGGRGKTAKGQSTAGRWVVIEEKVDGANLGISIDAQWRLRAQNRSHFVDSSSHKQFSTLEAWLEAHSSALFQVMEPERHVLFGEWLYAKHSIHYTRLPDYFLAFDLYDRRTGAFYSSAERDRLLQDTGISTVRSIAAGTGLLGGREDVVKFLDMPSAFYDGPVEGVYLKVEDNSAVPPTVLRRGKVVRPDFLQQIEEQWTRQKFTKNIVTHTYDDDMH